MGTENKTKEGIQFKPFGKQWIKMMADLPNDVITERFKMICIDRNNLKKQTASQTTLIAEQAKEIERLKADSDKYRMVLERIANGESPFEAEYLATNALK